VTIKIGDSPLSEFGIILYKKFGTDLTKPFDFKKFMRDIIPVLQKLHRNNKWHGDIKPANIVYDPYSTTSVKYKLIDLDFEGSNSSPMYILPYFLKKKNGGLYARIKQVWEEFNTFNLFTTSDDEMDILFEVYVKDDPKDFVNLLLKRFGIKDVETYIRIKSDEYAVAVVLFEMIGPLHLSLNSGQAKKIIDTLLSIEPYFIQQPLLVGGRARPRRGRGPCKTQRTVS
jgi:serine/threonine protein kinase